VYDFVAEEELPPTDKPFNVNKKREPPSPKTQILNEDSRVKPNVVFVLG
jgi:hypothetical protein